jgi:hypothetical protein
MDPQQQQPLGPYPPAGNNPYQFIMEPPKKQKGSGKFSLGDNPFIMRLIMISGGAIALIIATTVVLNLFFAPKTSVDDIVSIAQTEQEIIRIATQGQTASSSSIKDASINTQLAVTSQQQTWLNFLAQHKRKVPLKELNLKKNTTTDTQFTQARATSTFDGTFKTTLRAQLEAYNILLKDAADKATSENEKTTLLSHYNQILLLLQQLPQE